MVMEPTDGENSLFIHYVYMLKHFCKCFTCQDANTVRVEIFVVHYISWISWYKIDT